MRFGLAPPQIGLPGKDFKYFTYNCGTEQTWSNTGLTLALQMAEKCVHGSKYRNIILGYKPYDIVSLYFARIYTFHK